LVRADALSADPALAARVLSVANSPLYRGTSDITTVARAVNRLGARTVASIALAAGIGAAAMQTGCSSTCWRWQRLFEQPASA
jgi:HD-like signal output (HDOD) protein